MNKPKDIILAGSLLLSLSAGTAQAASITYNLDQSNALPDGTDYLSVSISDSTTTIGDIDFSVEVNTSAFTVSGNNFGMDNFYFNYALTGTDGNPLVINDSNITNITPATWDILSDKNAGGGFGFFEFDLKGTGQERTSLLTFSISGVDYDSINSYAVGYEGTGDAYFAAHVAGFDETYGVTSAKFASVVPVPAAVWLFGSGLVGLIGVARRRA